MTTGSMGAGRDSERFAAALEQGRQYVGPVLPGDELLHRELELVALLRESRASLAPSTDASARMRAIVMTAAATMVPADRDEFAADDDALVDTTLVGTTPAEDNRDTRDTTVVPIGSVRGRHRFPARLRASSVSDRRGALGVSAAAALMVLAVTGGGALFSRDALPGDTLYGMKQTTESGLIALTPGQGNKAQRQLDYAALRIDEVQTLNNGRTASTERSTEISQALRGFNEQAAAGSRMWLAGDNSDNAAQLADWAEAQQQRLSAMRSSMPSSTQSDADQSMRLLEQLQTRANALNVRKGCDTVTSGESDQFGPVPAKGACNAKESSPQNRQVVPGAPTRERTSTPSVERDGPSAQLPSTGGTRPNAPGLQLPPLPGRSSDTGDLGRNPDREPTTGADQVPGDEQPGLNLPLLPN